MILLLISNEKQSLRSTFLLWSKEKVVFFVYVVLFLIRKYAREVGDACVMEGIKYEMGFVQN